jgi:hypothetical protein
MNIVRVIEYRGTKLKVYGNYTKGIPSEEGSLALHPDFEASEIYDVSDDHDGANVTDLYTGLLNDIEKIVIDLMTQEDLDDMPEATEEDLDDIMQTLESSMNFIKEIQEASLPILFDLDNFVYDREELTKMANKMAIQLDSLDSPIIGAKIDKNGIRLVRLNDLKKIK